MRILIIAIALSLSSVSVKATDWGDYSVRVSLAQTIAIFIQESIYATSDSTFNSKAIGKQIQNDVQDYNQAGEVSAFLAEKILMVQSVNNDMSEQDAVDILLVTSDLLLK